nr:immunoglobulin heavy chain junction region [Macaca mulatta]
CARGGNTLFDYW